MSVALARVVVAAAVVQGSGAFVVPATATAVGGAAITSQASAAAQSFFGVGRGAVGSASRAKTCRRWRVHTRTRWGRGRRTGASTCRMQAGEKNLFDYIREEDVDTLRRYVERGGPVHVADTLGDTSLLVAASTGNPEVVKILCEAPDAEVDYPCFHGGETPLMVACTKGNLRVAEYLVNEAGASVNATNHRGDTALSLAAFWGRLDCLKFLLGLPDINTEIQNVQGKRAGEDMEALMRDESNDEETVKLLKECRVRQGIARL